MAYHIVLYAGKKCKLCKKQKIDFTSPGSCNKAEILFQGNKFLTFYGDDYTEYTLECNYCPKCGRKLEYWR